ncbi:primase 2 [Trypanosoma brucei equiperdum]|uniref:Primase 2 n=1 Tax=Trypanosoma brucei equiperdum TaxID=630700 RepID=A0A3L6LCJ6_9TRYP|nr:primase 2 [Trypanosoma brucei equiperdum]
MFHLPRAVQCALIASASPSSLRYATRCIGTSTDGPGGTRRGSAPTAGGRRGRPSAHMRNEAAISTSGGAAASRSASRQGAHIDYAAVSDGRTTSRPGVSSFTRAATTTLGTVGGGGGVTGSSVSQLSMQNVMEANQNRVLSRQPLRRTASQTAAGGLEATPSASGVQTAPMAAPATQGQQPQQQNRQVARTSTSVPVQPLPTLSSVRPPATKSPASSRPAIATSPSGTARSLRTPRTPRGTKAAAKPSSAAAAVNISAATTAGARAAAAAIVARASPTRVAAAGAASGTTTTTTTTAAGVRARGSVPSPDTRAALEKAMQAVNAAVKSATPAGTTVPIAAMATRPISRAAVEEAMRAVDAAVTATRGATTAANVVPPRSRVSKSAPSPRTPWGTRPAAKATTQVAASAPAVTPTAAAQGRVRSAATTPTATGKTSPARARRRASPRGAGATAAETSPVARPVPAAVNTTKVSETAATEAAVARALAAAAAAAAPSRARTAPKAAGSATTPAKKHVTVVTPTRTPRAAAATPQAVTVVTPTRSAVATTPVKPQVAVVVSPTRATRPTSPPAKPQAAVGTPARAASAVAPANSQMMIVTPTRAARSTSVPSKPGVTVVTPKRAPRAASTPAKSQVTVVTPTRSPRAGAAPVASPAVEKAPVPAAASVGTTETVATPTPRRRSAESGANTPKGKRSASGKRGAVDATEENTKASRVTTPTSTVATTPPRAEVLRDHSSQATTTGGGVANPFRGLHNHITRSYRLDQLQAAMKIHDLLLGRQEVKSGAFSFIRFACGPKFINDHREIVGPDAGGGVDVSGADEKKGSSRNSSRTNGSEDCPLVIAERLLSFPPHMHHFHTVCGRENVPCDFFADIDLPNETPAGGEKALLEVLNYLDVRLEAIGFSQPSFLVLTNEVPSAGKVSYHLHARSMGTQSDSGGAAAAGSMGSSGGSGGVGVDEHSAGGDVKQGRGRSAEGGKSRASHGKIVAFQDYRVVELLADEVNTTLGRTVIDEQCYRVNGMLRCAYSSKITVPQGMPLSSNTAGGYHRGKRLVPLLKAKDTALQKRLDDMAAHLCTLSDAQILERTFCIRTAPVKERRVTENDDVDNAQKLLRARSDYLRSFKLIRAKNIVGAQNAKPVEYDAYGNVVSRYLTESAKWHRFKTAVEKLHRLPPRAAECYDIWVRVGLALHNFSNEDHVFEEWVRFSLKCPQKYSRETCRRKWQQFDRNPDALNWRRGFNYLNSTVWRSVPGC